MRAAHTILFALLAASAGAEDAARPVPLLNVELTDARGVTTKLAGFHLLSGEHRFQGYLGSAQIEVGYESLEAIRVRPPNRPGGRMRADLLLRTGKEIKATFDEREGELLLAGFAHFGRVLVYFRDMRELRILGRSKRSDLPVYGPPSAGVDARVRDRMGVETELVGLRRPAGENVLPGVRGATSIAIPLRILEKLTLAPERNSPMLAAEARLRDGSSVRFQLPTYAEEIVYRGEAEFGAYRIRIGEVREITVHRPTPVLRDLDPAAAAEGREVKEAEAPR